MSLKSKRPPRKIHPVVEMEKATKEINLYAMMRSRITRGFDKFFAPMGGSEKIYGRLKNGGDVKISYLLALSKLLGENLLDYYIQRLPENARETVQTRELRQTIKEKDDETPSPQRKG